MENNKDNNDFEITELSDDNSNINTIPSVPTSKDSNLVIPSLPSGNIFQTIDTNVPTPPEVENHNNDFLTYHTSYTSSGNNGNSSSSAITNNVKTISDSPISMNDNQVFDKELELPKSLQSLEIKEEEKPKSKEKVRTRPNPYVGIPSKVVNNTNNGQESMLNSDELIKAYIGPNYEKIVGRTFNFAAFFLSYIYLFYRKMYFYSFVVFILTVLASTWLNNIIAIILVFLLCGFVTNGLYVNLCLKKINKLIRNNPDKSLLEIKGMCYVKGGRSGVGLLIMFIFMIFALIPIAIIFVMVKTIGSFGNLNLGSLFKFDGIGNITNIINNENNQKYNGVIMYDTEVNINKIFKINVPSKFKDSIMASDHEIDKQYYSNNSECSFNLGAVKGYTDSRKLIEEMNEYYSINNASNITSIKYNNLDWNRFSFGEDYYKSYYYATTVDNKVYLFNYYTGSSVPKDCESNIEKVIKSIESK